MRVAQRRGRHLRGRSRAAVDQHCHWQLVRVNASRGNLVGQVTTLIRLLYRAHGIRQKPAENLIGGLYAATTVVAQVEHETLSAARVQIVQALVEVREKLG